MIAFNRFGLGAKPGDLAFVAADPRGALIEEVNTLGIAAIEVNALPASPDALQQLFQDRQERRVARERTAMEPPPQMDSTGAQSMIGLGAEASRPAKQQGPNVELRLFHDEAMARFKKAASAPTGFVERLVAFWSNHFLLTPIDQLDFIG